MSNALGAGAEETSLAATATAGAAALEGSGECVLLTPLEIADLNGIGVAKGVTLD
jgi:hypothetical protein